MPRVSRKGVRRRPLAWSDLSITDQMLLTMGWRKPHLARNSPLAKWSDVVKFFADNQGELPDNVLTLQALWEKNRARIADYDESMFVAESAYKHPEGI